MIESSWWWLSWLPGASRASSLSIGNVWEDELDQVLEDLALFQEIANRYHGGNLQSLIQHHLDSPDTTFHDEGAAIQTMVETAERLRESLQALNADLMHQLVYLIRRIDPQIARGTWEAYQPAFPLSVESVVFAFIVGVVVWLAFLAVWHFIAAMVPPAGRPRSR